MNTCGAEPGQVWSWFCSWAHLSQLKPSTLSLQRHCPVLTSHSCVLPDGEQEHGLMGDRQVVPAEGVRVHQDWTGSITLYSLRTRPDRARTCSRPRSGCGSPAGSGRTSPR